MYSEVLGSEECSKCTDQLWILLAPLLIAICIIIAYILFQRESNNTDSKSTILGYLVPHDFVSTAKYMLLDQLILYFQSLGFISLSVTKTTVIGQLALLDVTGLLESNGSSGSGICFMNGLTAKNEILLTLSLPAIIYIFLFILQIIVCVRKKQVLTCCKKSVYKTLLSKKCMKIDECSTDTTLKVKFCFISIKSFLIFLQFLSEIYYLYVLNYLFALKLVQKKYIIILVTKNAMTSLGF